MKKIILLSACILLAIAMHAQSIEDLRSINLKATNQFIKPEELDVLMIGLRKFETAPVAGQDTLMMDTYKIISNSYISSSHFKQSYQVYQKYLSYKENVLFNDKSTAINKVINVNAEKQRHDEETLKELKLKQGDLQSEITVLSTKGLRFKKYFSGLLIILSVLFAVILVGSGIRIFSLRSKLNMAHEKMKRIHRQAVIGNFDEGIRTSLQTSFAQLEAEANDIQKELKKFESFNLAKEAKEILSGINKMLSTKAQLK